LLLGCVLAFAAALFVFRLSAGSLWDVDEPRYAEAGREMLATGDLLTPRFNGAPWLGPAPLWIWLQAASGRMFGFSEWSARLPGAASGVAGVLAFSVSGRTREFGIRLAVGSEPRDLLIRVIAEGAVMAVVGLVVGVVCGFGFAQLAGAFLGELKAPGLLPVAGSALVLLIAAVTASVIPAARAARVDVMQALRTE
jgi:hypothetical protein